MTGNDFYSLLIIRKISNRRAGKVIWEGIDMAG